MNLPVYQGEVTTLGDGTKFLADDGSYKSVAAGSGTVTSVSVVTANGVSGSVATGTTTPAITLALGAITPTSVAASGTVTGSNLSGTNTGDQTSVSGNAGTVTTNANLTGDVTSVGNASTIIAGLKQTTVRTAADVVNNANPVAWADVTGLSVALGTGTFTFECEGSVTSAATTTRMLLGATFSGTATIQLQYVWCTNGGTMTTGAMSTAYDTSPTPGSSLSTGGYFRLIGTIVVTVAGTFTIRNESNVAGSAVTIKKGATLTVKS